jgi:sugar transferase EpsL
VKRIFDLVLTFLLFPVFGPVLAITASAVLIALGRPIFFRQERGGYLGTRFMLWKFRTMSNECDKDGKLLPDANRLSGFGRFLRSTSLDEVPCFINIMKGNLSFVGPRPFISRYLPLYSPAQMRRHNVVPGITGWAQVKGRNSLSWEEKFELDVWYVENQSALLDLKIILITLVTVLRRRGISGQGEATMSEFTGTKL